MIAISYHSKNTHCKEISLVEFKQIISPELIHLLFAAKKVNQKKYNSYNQINHQSLFVVTPFIPQS